MYWRGTDVAGNRINAKERGLTVSLNLLKTYIIIHVGYITHSTKHVTWHTPCHLNAILSRILCLRPLHRERQAFTA